MKKLFLYLIIGLSSITLKAQQDVLLSQYMFNHLAINPGYAGSKNYMMATLLHRKQWVGWDGAPESQLLTLHGPLENKKIGLGASLMHDHIGVTNRIDATANFAYHLQVSHYIKLGLGLQGGFSQYTFNNSDLLYWQSNDRVFNQNPQTGLLPNFGAGAFLYSKKYYFGISVPHMLNYNTNNGLGAINNYAMPNQERHYFGEAGFVVEVNPDLIFKPSTLVKYVHGAPVEADFNLNVLFAQTFWVGASYRTNDAAVAIFEMQLSRKLRIGYSYDFTVTDIGKYSAGSHEIMIGFDFGYDVTRMKTPRYF